MKTVMLSLGVCLLIVISSACTIDIRGNALIERFTMTGDCAPAIINIRLRCTCGLLAQLDLLTDFASRLCHRLFPNPRAWLEACQSQERRLSARLSRDSRREPSLEGPAIQRLPSVRFVSRAANNCFQSFPPRSPLPEFTAVATRRPRVSRRRIATRRLSGSVLSRKSIKRTIMPAEKENSFPDSLVQANFDLENSLKQTMMNGSLIADMEKCAKCMRCLQLKNCVRVRPLKAVA